MSKTMATASSWQRLSLVAMLLLGIADPASAGREDQSARVDANAERDAARNAERGAARADERAARDDIRAAEDRARADSRSIEDAARSAEDAQRDAMRATGDASRAAADAAEQAAKDAADAAEEAAKVAADTAEEAAKAAEDAARDAADAAEDAAEEAAEDATRLATAGGAAALHDLAADEAPEMDRDGYPVRRGELIALDLDRRVRSLAEARGFRIIDTTRLASLDSSMTRLAVPSGMTARDALDQMRALDARGSYDLAHYYGAQFGAASGEDDVGIDRQPPIAEPVLNLTRVGQPIVPRLRVGMIDTGVVDHPALLGVRLTLRDFGTGQRRTEHGTAVASVLAGDGVGQIVAANVFRGEGDRQYTSPDAIVRALAWLVQQDVAVINISLAGPRNAVLDRLIGRAQADDHIIVAAAGNGGPTAAPAYPAALPGVVAVTAVDARGRVYRHANQGSYIRFAALGVGISVAAPSGTVSPRTGTSFSSPHIAALLGHCVVRSRIAGGVCIGQLDQRAIDRGVIGRDAIYGVGIVP